MTDELEPRIIVTVLHSALTNRQYLFVIEYCKDFLAGKAAERAGYSAKSADEIAWQLLQKPQVQDAIEERKQQLAAVARLTPEYILRELIGVIEIDRRVCCRFCYGIEHQYQWTESEYSRALNKALKAGESAPEIQGGFGYIKSRAPFPECSQCRGEGVLATTDELKKSDKIKALELAARLGGMIVERTQGTLSGPGGGPVPVATVNVNELSDAQLAALAAGGNVIDGGSIGGSLSFPAPNSPAMSELENASSP